jgi:chemotaxis protein methyltransferase WspC
VAFDAIIGLLRARIGLELTSVGESAGVAAVRARMQALGLDSQERYLDALRERPGELDALVEEIVVSETWFFREPAAYLLLCERARARTVSAADPYRVLSVPCATGEEPYSIAMALLDAGIARGSLVVRGVDVSRRALALAERAVYRDSSFRADSSRYERFFERYEGGRRVVESVRSSVQLGPGNVLDQSLCAGERFDAVLCRNLLIYLDREARSAAFQNLKRLMRPDGLLFVGHAESAIAVDQGLWRTGDAACFAFTQQRPHKLPSRRPPAARASNRPRAARAVRPARAPRTTEGAGRAVGKPAPLDTIDALRTLADRGELGVARTRCEALIKATPTAPAYALLGVVCQAGGDIAAAQHAFERALYLEPAHYESLVHLSLIHERAGQRELASALRKRAERERRSEKGSP